MMNVARIVATAALTVLAGFSCAEAGRIQRVVSPGGIEAWLVEEHAVPVISMNFVFAGGSTQDPEGKEGVANLITTLMDEGAGEIVSAKYQSKVEELSMRQRFEESRDWMRGEVKVLSENRDESFALLALAINQPRFDKDAVERMKTQLLSGLRAEEKDPEAILGHAWSQALYGEHPYGRPTDGTIASLSSITPDDVKAYHARVFCRDTLKIGVVGDIDAATLGPILDKVFGNLPAKAQLRPVSDVKPKTGFTIRKQMDIPQTMVRISYPGIMRDDPDFMAAFIMNHILGGGSFSSWLYDEVREKRGLAYTVTTSLGTNRHGGLFAGGVGTRADKADESLKIIREQIARMAEVGPSEEELAKAKAFLTGSFGLRFDTSDKIADFLVAMQTDNLGIDYWDRRNAMIEAVTLADVKRVAKRIFTAEPGIVMVGRVANGG
jgi:zinc protease